MLATSWDNVKSTAISKCFRKVVFFQSNVAQVISLQKNENSSIVTVILRLMKNGAAWLNIDDFVNVYANLIHYERKDTEFLYVDVTVEEEEDVDGIASLTISSYASDLETLKTFIRYLENSDLILNTITYFNELRSFYKCSLNMKKLSIDDCLLKD